VGPIAIYRPFRQTSTHHSESSGCPFLDLSSATGSASRHLHHDSPWASFNPKPLGHHCFIPRPGTHAHIQNYQIHAHIFDSLQILFTSGIWFSCVQVLGHYTSTQPLQVYTQHWHVVIPSESHLHLQSHPLTFSSRIPISGSVVPTPPFASSILSPGSTLTHMSCPIHSTLFRF
jgi:hypothetical protein